MSDQHHQLHVPGCALRAAVIEGPNAHRGETLDAWAKRVTFTRCTCRRALAGLIAVVLRPFGGLKLTEQLLQAMRDTVDEYMSRTRERYGDNGWAVELTAKPDGNVDVHLVPPAALELLAGDPEPRVVPPPSAPLADDQVAEAMIAQTSLDTHILACEGCHYAGDRDILHLCSEGQRLQKLEADATDRALETLS